MSDHTFDANATIDWYDRYSDKYDEDTFQQSDDNYGGDLYRLKLIEKLLPELGCDTVLDAGCGTAEPLLALLRQGLTVRGFDFSPGMIKQGKNKLLENNLDPDLIEVADVTDEAIVDHFGRNSFDAVVANGILPYVEDVEKAHTNLSALVKPGGYYISAYSNELLDLSTLNRFTVAFHKRNFIDPLPIDQESSAALLGGIEKLITNPDVPKNIYKSARNEIYLRADNPLTIGNELKKFGLHQIDILFYKYHAFPPLLSELSDEFKKIFVQNSRSYEIERAKDWRGYFLASTFIVVCRKD